MKKLIFILAIAACSTGAFTQVLPDEEVPTIIVQAHHDRFPDASKSQWEIFEGNLYVTQFILNGDDVYATYDPRGNWINSRTSMKQTALPEPVQITLRTDYIGYKIDNIGKIEAVNTAPYYEAHIMKDGEWFDLTLTPEGKVMNKIHSDVMDTQ